MKNFSGSLLSVQFGDPDGDLRVGSDQISIRDMNAAYQKLNILARSVGSPVDRSMLATTGEEGAKYFLKHHPEIWTKWVSPEVAEKVKNAVM